MLSAIYLRYNELEEVTLAIASLCHRVRPAMRSYEVFIHKFLYRNYHSHLKHTQFPLLVLTQHLFFPISMTTWTCTLNANPRASLPRPLGTC